MAGISKVLADDLGEDPCGGPDADAGHRGQDRGKRVGLHEGFDLRRDPARMDTTRLEALGERWGLGSSLERITAALAR